MKNLFKFFIIIIILLIVFLSVIALLTNGFQDFQFGGDSVSGITDENGNDLNPNIVHELPSKLNISGQALALAQENDKKFIEVTLIATVLPENASDKSVSWSVCWADGSNSPDVSEYLTVTPKSDGSNIASVKCYKPFDKNIKISVVSSDGGFTANCIVSYIGISTGLTLKTSALAPNGYYEIPASKSFTFEFSSVDYFDENAELKLSASNNSSNEKVFYVCDFTQTWDSTLTFDEDTLSSVSIKDMSSFCFSYRVTGNCVEITGLNRVSSYYVEDLEGSEDLIYKHDYKGHILTNFWTSSQNESLKSYAAQNEALFSTSYFTLRIMDSISGEYYDINFQII